MKCVKLGFAVLLCAAAGTTSAQVGERAGYPVRIADDHGVPTFVLKPMVVTPDRNRAATRTAASAARPAPNANRAAPAPFSAADGHRVARSAPHNVAGAMIRMLTGQ